MGSGGLIAAAALVGVVAAGAGGLAAPGDPDEVWRDTGLRVVDRATRADDECASHSFGQVQELLKSVPCVALDRMLLTVTDDKGGTAVVFVAWIEFDDRDKAGEFKRLEDVHGTGDLVPLSGSLLRIEDVPFTALNYDSTVVDGVTVVIAEAENVAGGFTAEYLDDIAAVAVLTPRP
ncbi:hypothetical protein [Saccharothrix texasensis]|uniref:Secreted protein n=1 Tax=Saccharothrix texasensis TaxID=103734 RepID=A0A3N1H415_9PSEU|nr:hypothetical protein [Saccharothrix texasensis]ROP36972.1 hypothetical protein EDD40_2254 [Saccharothrix texasensis]